MKTETDVIAGLLAEGLNDHVRLHGPDGDHAGEAVETGDAHGLVVTQAGVRYAVSVERVRPLHEPGPLAPGQAWAALKEDLRTRISHDARAHRHFLDTGNIGVAAAYGGLLSAHRATLAKMQELEG